MDDDLTQTSGDDDAVLRPAATITLEPALYLVATPIGNARDITLRALDILTAADVLAAEDTRTLRHLMQIHGIPLNGRRIIAHHDHNAAKTGPGLLALVREGRSVAYASDAGTPLIADPGFSLVREAATEGVAVRSVPGASALLAALTVAGLPTDRFLFAGFVPSAQGARRKWLEELSEIQATIVIFESPRRVKHTLNELCDIDADRDMVICRELTKKFEEVLRGTPKTLLDQVPDEGLRGEVVIAMAAPIRKVVDEATLRAALTERLIDMSVRDAATEVAGEFGVARKMVYGLAVSIEKEKQ